MKIKALKSFFGEGAHTRRGEVVEVDPHRGKMLVARGMGSEIEALAVPKDTDRVPFAERQPGGQTGEAKLSSSSPAAQAPSTSTSSPDKAARDSSASTRDTGSRRSQTLSMPVTGSGGKQVKHGRSAG